MSPFVNAEKPQYLVIEDSFPNGRPALEKGFGVYMADRNTVNLSERMKITVCLNPVHSATGPLGVVLGYDLFAHMLNTNEDMMKMARMVAYGEGLHSSDLVPVRIYSLHHPLPAYILTSPRFKEELL